MAEMLTLSNEIAVEVKRRRGARRLRITVRQDGRVMLTLPFLVSLKRGRWFLESKREWIAEKRTALMRRPGLFQGSRKEFLSHREAAKRHIMTRLNFFQAHYQLVPQRVTVRNQKTRWGSCSARGNLSFNYRLILLPETLCDYVVVHELCHLQEMNHSARFWRLVEETIPDYLARRRELRHLSRGQEIV